MYSLNQLKTLVSCGRDPARSLPFRRGFLLIPLMLAAFTLTQVQAAVNTPDPGSVPPTNTADGAGALQSITSGTFNSAFGFFSVLALTDAQFNTGVGAGALLSNTTGINTTACGAFALFSNGAGDFNNAVGANSLLFNTDGDSNNQVDT